MIRQISSMSRAGPFVLAGAAAVLIDVTFFWRKRSASQGKQIEGAFTTKPIKKPTARTSPTENLAGRGQIMGIVRLERKRCSSPNDRAPSSLCHNATSDVSERGPGGALVQTRCQIVAAAKARKIKSLRGSVSLGDSERQADSGKVFALAEIPCVYDVPYANRRTCAASEMTSELRVRVSARRFDGVARAVALLADEGEQDTEASG
jgi:hypothetical protein